MLAGRSLCTAETATSRLLPLDRTYRYTDEPAAPAALSLLACSSLQTRAVIG